MRNREEAEGESRMMGSMRRFGFLRLETRGCGMEAGAAVGRWCFR
jgi:hypothetical protein